MFGAGWPSGVRRLERRRRLVSQALGVGALDRDPHHRDQIVDVDRLKCIEAGASDYVSKPVDIDYLISVMRVSIQRTDAQRLTDEPAAAPLESADA